jgi:class 3 adenylate cyclase
VEDSQKEELLGMHILVVDDHQDNCDLLIALLEDQGYRSLFTAADGNEALTLLRRRRNIDLVLLDINMPNMNGYEVLEEIQQDQTLRKIPVIMVTALNQLESQIRCIEKGAEDYITKPVEETLLKARVGASLERKYLRNKEQQLLRIVQREKKRSEEVLFNVLPKQVAERLKKGGEGIADAVDDATVLFADLVEFTQLSTHISPSALVHILNVVFRGFDQISSDLKLEKIKTIGDSYMVVGGLPPETKDHTLRCLQFAYSALDYVRQFNEDNPIKLQLRVGMHCGPVVAGVIGQTRFTYDLWGETVNVASRMESLGLPGRVQLSDSAFRRLEGSAEFESRGLIDVKGKGEMTTYLGPANLPTGFRVYSPPADS